MRVLQLNSVCGCGSTGRIAAELADAFGEGSRTVREPLEIALWCRPWLFLLLLGLVGAEWTLRKVRGLV